MEMKQKGVLHNEFLIEVIDANTKEIKGQYKAYNIILDQLFTRLMNISSYFTSIHFGTGTGELDRTRTSLFSFLGAKGASVVSETSRVDLSDVKVQKVIQIMPEEYVGSVITEVGVGFGTTATNLCTHAFILDSQGNPVGITKSSTDVINIYATVYITYETGHENIEIANNGYLYGTENDYQSNPFTSLLVGQSNSGVITTAKWYVGSGNSNLTAKGVPEKIITSSAEKTFAAANWIKDVENRTITSNPYRFGVNDGNGNISEIGIVNFIRASFPIPGLWEGYRFKDKPLGVGDGVTKEFLVTSVENPRPGSMVVKSNDIVKVGGYEQKNYFDGNPTLIRSYYDGSDYYGTSAQGSFCSRDRRLIVESQLYSGSSSSSSSYAIKIYETEENGRFLRALENLEMRTFYYGDITEDKRFIVVSSRNSAGSEGPCFLYRVKDIRNFILEEITSTVDLNNKEETETNYTGGGGQGVCFSRDGGLLFTSYGSVLGSTYRHGRLFKYNKEKDTYEKSNIDFNGFSITGGLSDIRVTADNKYFVALTLETNTENNLMVFEIGNNGIKAVDKNVLFDDFQVTGGLTGLKISDDGSILVLGSAADKGIYIYQFIGGKYTLKNKLLTGFSSLSIIKNALDISPDNNFICFSFSNSAYLIKKDEVSGEYRFFNSSQFPYKTGSGSYVYRGVVFGPNSDTILLNRQYTGTGTFANPGTYTEFYSLKKNATRITFDEPPVEGEILTFDCDVDYIPKDTNSVLDLQITIQFSDANETT